MKLPQLAQVLLCQQAVDKIFVNQPVSFTCPVRFQVAFCEQAHCQGRIRDETNPAFRAVLQHPLLAATRPLQNVESVLNRDDSRKVAAVKTPIPQQMFLLEIGDAQIANQVLGNQIRDRLQAFLNRGNVVELMEVKKLDPIGLQPLQRSIEGFLDVQTTQSTMIRGSTIHRFEQLGG